MKVVLKRETETTKWLRCSAANGFGNNGSLVYRLNYVRELANIKELF